MPIKRTVLTILIFIALDRLLSPTVGLLFPINALGVLFSFLYWFSLLFISYRSACYFTESK